MNKDHLAQPVFVLGNPRSGTTLLRLTITSHPDVCIPPESHFFLWLEDKYQVWSKEDGYDSYLDDLFDSQKFETWNLNKKLVKDYLVDMAPKNYAELNACVYAHYASINQPSAKYWGDKNMPWKNKTEKIFNYYPKARFIHIHRDGRDIACSYKDLNSREIISQYAPKLPNEVESIALQWKKNINMLMDFLVKVPQNQVLQVSYENLILDQENTAQKICQFLNIPEVNLSHLAPTDSKSDEPTDFLQWKEKTTEPIDKENVGKFNKTLTIEEISCFNTICGKELKTLGYSL